MNLILIGFMGSGKSSVAKTLASILHLPVLEMDDVVLKKTKTKSMHDVFAKGGELLLRETEIAIAKEYSQKYMQGKASISPHIISTGAGVVHNKIVLDHLKKQDSKVFFLNASFDTIAFRLADDTLRPLFHNQVEAQSLYDFRKPLYSRYADLIVEVDDKSIEEVAQEIVDNHLR